MIRSELIAPVKENGASGHRLLLPSVWVRSGPGPGTNQIGTFKEIYYATKNLKHIIRKGGSF